MKHQMRTIIYLALLLILAVGLLLTITACSKSPTQSDKYEAYEGLIDPSKPIAWGENSDIYVFCDEVNWKPIEKRLTSSLQRETLIVAKEKYFHIVRADIKNMDELTKYKNLLFIGDLKTQAAVSRHIRNSMPAGMAARVEQSGGEILVAKNLWVKDQLVVYMVASDPETLNELNNMQATRLFTIFLNRLGQRLAYQTYQTKLMPAEFFVPYPYSVKVPGNYRLFANDEKNRFLSLLFRMQSESRDFPDKYLSVYYEDMPTNQVTYDWLLNKRKELAYKYYDQDEFNPKQMQRDETTLAGYTALRIMGPWKNMKHYIGGGFQSFAFYDAKQKKAYLIDNAVYFPAGDKLPELLDMQRISDTFKTK